MTKIFSLLLILSLLFPLEGKLKELKAEEIIWVKVKGDVELGMAKYIERAVHLAEKKKSSFLVLEISTYGGRLDAAEDIKEILLKTPLPTYSFINPRAISAGALIALATSHIYIHPGGNIGAATPVMEGSGPAPEKIKSFVRSSFRSTAEVKKHPSALAEAFVDEEIEVVEVEGGKILKKEEVKKGEKIIKTISPKGKLLTLTGKEAVELGLAEATASDREEFLRKVNLQNLSVKEITPNWGEKLAGIFTHPLISGLLLSVGLLGIIFELQMPGWGISGTIGSLCLFLFFAGKYFSGLAEIGDIILFFIGLILIGIEIFLLPGFGIAGITGILALLTGLYLSLVKRPLPHTPLDMERIKTAFYSLGWSLALIIIGVLVLLRFFPKTPLFEKIALTTSQKEGYTAPPDYSYLLGKRGKTLTPVRPAGKVSIEGKIIDVVSEGEFIPKGKKVEIIKVEGARVVVREVR